MSLLLYALSGAFLPTSTPDSSESRAFQRWRRHLRDHIVVIGFGAKGRGAVDAMLGQGRRPGDIVVVDVDAAALKAAASRGLITRHGCATDRGVLREAGVQRAAAVIVAIGSDDTAAFAVRALRDIADNVKVFVAVHDSRHSHLLRKYPNTVVVREETAGRLLGTSTRFPEIVCVIDDLLTPETGYVIAERTVEPHEVGLAPQLLSDAVIGVVRNGRLSKAHMPAVGSLIAGDRVLFVRRRK